MILSNIRSLLGHGGKTKVKFLSDQAIQQNALAVAVTESCLTPEVKDPYNTLELVNIHIAK